MRTGREPREMCCRSLPLREQVLVTLETDRRDTCENASREHQHASSRRGALSSSRNMFLVHFMSAPDTGPIRPIKTLGCRNSADGGIY